MLLLDACRSDRAEDPELTPLRALLPWKEAHVTTRHSVRLLDELTLERLAVSTWVDTTLVPRSCMLITLDPLRPGVSHDRMLPALLALAHGLHLTPATEPSTYAGWHVYMSTMLVALDYGHTDHLMRIPWPSPDWQAIACAPGGSASPSASIRCPPVPPGPRGTPTSRARRRSADCGPALAS